MINDIMDNQPCQELSPLDLFSLEVTDTVQEIYNPIFSKIRVFGDVYDPVFVAKDVQSVLGLVDMNYKRDGMFEWGVEKIKIKIKTAAGMQDLLALTEQGIYKAIWHSKTDMAKKFQTFMKVVMKRLRINGIVIIDEAMADLKLELKNEKALREAIDRDASIEHKDYIRLKYRDEVRENVLWDKVMEVALLNKKIENIRDPSLHALASRVDRLEKKFMKPLIVMLSAPPKEHRDAFEYELEYLQEWDVDGIDETDVMIYTIGFTPLKSKLAISKIYIHNDITLEDFHKKLEMFRLPKCDGFYTNMYEISLEMLRVIKEDLNQAREMTF